MSNDMEKLIKSQFMADFIGEQMRAYLNNAPEKVLRYGGLASHTTKTAENKEMVAIMPREAYGQALNLGFYFLKEEEPHKYHRLKKTFNNFQPSDILGYEESREALSYLPTNVTRFLLAQEEKEERQHEKAIKDNLGVIYSTNYQKNDISGLKTLLNSVRKPEIFGEIFQNK